MMNLFGKKLEAESKCEINMEKFAKAEMKRRKKAEAFIERAAQFLAEAAQYIWGDQELLIGESIILRDGHFYSDDVPLMELEGKQFWENLKQLKDATEWMVTEVERIDKERETLYHMLDDVSERLGQSEMKIRVVPKSEVEPSPV